MAKSYQIDVENAVFELNGLKGTLVGLDNQTFIALALHGAVAVIRGRKNPERTWEKICAGTFFEVKKKYPIVVRAYANLQSIDLEAALAQWKALPTADKYILKNTPQIRMEVDRLQGGDKPLYASDEEE